MKLSLLCHAKWIVAVLSVANVNSNSTAESPIPVVESRRIWDAAPHNAFTDLVRFQDRWFCVFREGEGHVSPDGALRVITSTDGETWESAARITSANSDLRDAKISVTPNGQLMLCGAEALHDTSQKYHQSLAWFSADGRNWSEQYSIGEPDYWLWRITWHKGIAYGIGYATRPGTEGVRLYSSNDGKKFTLLAKDKELFSGREGNESSILFLPDDSAVCLLRRDIDEGTAQIGVAQPPYTTWKWKDLGLHIGGPHLLRLPDGRLVASGRLRGSGVHTSLVWIDPTAGTAKEFLTFPSGGDTSYPGLVFHDGMLWVSYYSSHEGKTSIYLAKTPIPSDDGSRDPP
jgi:hypothetical protein